MQIPDGSDLPQGAGYGSLVAGEAMARDATAATIIKSFIVVIVLRFEGVSLVFEVLIEEEIVEGGSQCVEERWFTRWSDDLYVHQLRSLFCRGHARRQSSITSILNCELNIAHAITYKL